MGSSRDRDMIRNFFSGLGNNIFLKGRIDELNNKVARLTETVKLHRGMIESRDRQIDKLMARIGELEKGQEALYREEDG